MMADKKQLPFELDGASIYYAGPTPAPPGMPIGSCGPTTSSRMDPCAPLLLDNGLAAMIGKGPRNSEVVDAIVRNKAVYLCAIGGAGALCSKSIVAYDEIAFKDLGCESIKRLEVKDFPVIVAIDSFGGNLFK
jgi:fumarate hydratase subunit beta